MNENPVRTAMVRLRNVLPVAALEVMGDDEWLAVNKILIELANSAVDDASTSEDAQSSLEVFKPALTVQQRRVLLCFGRYFQQVGIPPTFEWMGDQLGVNKSTIFEHMRALIKKLYIERELTHVSRGLLPTRKGRRYISKHLKECGNEPSSNGQDADEGS